MYLYGTRAAKLKAINYKWPSPGFAVSLELIHNERMSHAYYKYGFEHPVDDPWERHDKTEWLKIPEVQL